MDVVMKNRIESVLGKGGSKPRLYKVNPWGRMLRSSKGRFVSIAQYRADIQKAINFAWEQIEKADSRGSAVTNAERVVGLVHDQLNEAMALLQQQHRLASDTLGRVTAARFTLKDNRS